MSNRGPSAYQPNALLLGETRSHRRDPSPSELIPHGLTLAWPSLQDLHVMFSELATGLFHTRVALTPDDVRKGSASGGVEVNFWDRQS